MNWKLAGNIAFATIAGLVILALLNFLIESTVLSAEDMMWAVLGVTFIGLAIYGGIRNAGSGLVWFTRTAGAIVIILTLGFIFFGQERMNNILFGGWLDNLELDEKSSGKIRESDQKNREVEPTVMELSMTEWSQPIRVRASECIRSWGKNPAGNAYSVEALGINETQWTSWNDWKATRTDNPGWLRYKANEPGAVVYYEIGPRGTCK